MVIRKKVDVETFIETFGDIAKWDNQGGKWYFVFSDDDRGGYITLMMYPDQAFTYHGQGNNYCDESETGVDLKYLKDWIWKRRKQINQSIKGASKEI